MSFFVFFFFFVFLLQSSLLYSCPTTCDLALASYYVTHSTGNLTYVGSLFNIPYSDITPFNPQLTSPDSIIAGQRIHIPLSSCDCSQNPNFLSHTVTYTTLGNDTYTSIAQNTYTNLTTVGFLEFVNRYEAHRIPVDVPINVTINCSCGDAKVSREYGLFETYPLREEDTLLSIAKEFGFTDGGTLIEQFNPGVNFTTGQGLLFIPTKGKLLYAFSNNHDCGCSYAQCQCNSDEGYQNRLPTRIKHDTLVKNAPSDQNGSYRPLKSSKSGISGGAVAGIIIAVVFILLGLGSYLYFGVYKRKKVKSQLTPSSMEASILHSNVSKDPGITSQERSASLLGGFTVDRSVEFSYEELARATDDFSMANKIGEGGFGAVYYAELRGEKAAIKKMDMEASKEFLAELNVLTHVHHLNLVRLIGYCVETSLFLVYEFIENGNLSQHLRGSDRDPLEWSARIQIALDSARGLEYIHEHTVPVYIHRDIKSANILLDRKFHAKVADFGLTKLTQAGGMTQPTRLVGTFGYMPPEYAQYGDVSPKIDVYAFGVVLYELISAKEAIVKGRGAPESTGLVALFEEAHSQPDPREHLQKLVDPRLGNNYSLDAAYKLALLAKACTQENPQLRPSMRTIVVALMTLSSTTEDWDIGSFYENQALVNLMSGR